MTPDAAKDLVAVEFRLILATVCFDALSQIIRMFRNRFAVGHGRGRLATYGNVTKTNETNTFCRKVTDL